MDLFDGIVSLLLLSVDHDDSTSGVGEGAGDFIADAERASDDDGNAAVEVLRMDRLGADACCLLENGLHFEAVVKVESWCWSCWVRSGKAFRMGSMG